MIFTPFPHSLSSQSHLFVIQSHLSDLNTFNNVSTESKNITCADLIQFLHRLEVRILSSTFIPFHFLSSLFFCPHLSHFNYLPAGRYKLQEVVHFWWTLFRVFLQLLYANSWNCKAFAVGWETVEIKIYFSGFESVLRRYSICQKMCLPGSSLSLFLDKGLTIPLVITGKLFRKFWKINVSGHSHFLST